MAAVSAPRISLLLFVLIKNENIDISFFLGLSVILSVCLFFVNIADTKHSKKKVQKKIYYTQKQDALVYISYHPKTEYPN